MFDVEVIPIDSAKSSKNPIHVRNITILNSLPRRAPSLIAFRQHNYLGCTRYSLPRIAIGYRLSMYGYGRLQLILFSSLHC